MAKWQWHRLVCVEDGALRAVETPHGTGVGHQDVGSVLEAWTNQGWESGGLENLCI